MNKTNANPSKPLSNEELQELVSSTDTGGRNPSGFTKRLLLGGAFAWSLFQIWIASPLPFLFNSLTGIQVVLNSTEERSIHLAFALFLAYIAYPAFKKSPRNYVPVADFLFAFLAALSAGYIYLFYDQLAQRPGALTTTDIVTGSVGILLLLEGTRRALGPALTIIASIFLVYTFAGPYVPHIIAHKGNSLGQVINHQWTSTEGVFGIALGVSTKFVFLFVLFGALLEKAGAGNYFIKIAFSMLGHLRGGPAKAAVAASGMTGLISGSSIANVVTTGTFTIPMMKRVGFSAEKAGAVEVASSVNGQIMPPVMGAAAFLMVEYVNMSYFEIVKHAFLPALISYIALFYIVHIEAVKKNMPSLTRPGVPKPFLGRIMGFLLGFLVVGAIGIATKYSLGWLHLLFGSFSGWIVAALLVVVYVGLIKYCAAYPELEMDDPNKPMVKLPPVGPTVKSGLHFILPIIVLVWCLMVQRLSPGLSAFWAVVLLIFILLTQKPLFAYFRNQSDFSFKALLLSGFDDFFQGMITGGRNMIGIGIATATAGIIVGAVSQTGVGLALSEVVEILSMGNLFLMLLLVALLSLVLGMGLPTTANYIVVSSLLAGVVVQLGEQNGLIVPLIAVHLFVFYFGIMADVTPPVGLASFAAAAVSGGNPIRTGVVAFVYSLRTAILPFFFIFNTDILLIDLGIVEGVVKFVIATVAILLFTAATQGYFLTKNRFYEGALLLLIAFTLFRPGFWMDRMISAYEPISASHFSEELVRLKGKQEIRVKIKGENEVGEERIFYALIKKPEGATAEEKISNFGLDLIQENGKVVVDMVGFYSKAEEIGFEYGQEILTMEKTNHRQPAKEWLYLPAILILGLVIMLQRRRIESVRETN